LTALPENVQHPYRTLEKEEFRQCPLSLWVVSLSERVEVRRDNASPDGKWRFDPTLTPALSTRIAVKTKY
jgi:hypothetical protein